MMKYADMLEQQEQYYIINVTLNAQSLLAITAPSVVALKALAHTLDRLSERRISMADQLTISLRV